jgi:signal transduction histidine kinase
VTTDPLLVLADRRVIRAYFAVGIGGVVAYHWLSAYPYAYEMIGAYAVVGTLVGALRRRGPERQPWLAFAAGFGLMVAGDLAWDLTPNAGSPNISDLFYMAAYPLLALGLLVLTRRTAGRGNVVDTLIVAGSLGTVLWPLLFASFLHGGQTLAQRLTLGVYPCWDLVLLAAVVRLALTGSLHTRRSLLLAASVGLFLVGDICWFDSVNTYVLGNWEDYAWLTAYVCWGTAALHPAPIGQSERPEVTPFRRFALLAIPVAFLPAAIVIGMTRNDSSEYVDGSLISVVLTLLLYRFATVLRGLEEARRELREQNRLKDELISVVSHDLRTPLTSIMGYLELALAAETGPQEARRFLEVVQRNTGRLHRLVEDLLFVSRVQAGKDALNVGVVDIAEIARATVVAALPAADTGGVALECRLACNDETLGDEHRIAEVIENLLSNALKFTPPGGAVDVWVGRLGQSLVVRVSDTGVGIPPEDLRHLFDRFFRAAGTDGVPGAGLGLSIVKAIVEAHGGHVGVQSQVGAGTTFEVRFPRVAVERPAAVAAAA